MKNSKRKALLATVVSVLAMLCSTIVAATPPKEPDEPPGETPRRESVTAADRTRPQAPSGPVSPGAPAPLAGVPFVGEVEAVSADTPPSEQLRSLVSAHGTTVAGKLVFDDLRELGHFDWRRDRWGNEGTAPSGGTANLLGAWFVVADFYELDSVAGSPLHLNCKKEEYLGSTTLNAAGDFSLDINEADNCGADDDSTPDIGVRFRLRFCNSDTVCFSIRDDQKNVYQLWHHDANPDDPLEAESGSHALGTAVFEVSAGDAYAKAAANYAYMAEVMWIWHFKNSVPFDPRGDGEVTVQYPSTEADNHGTAYTASDHLINLKSTWNYQSTVWHEYGHVVHTRAWNGTTGNCGDCPGDDYSRNDNGGWSANEQEYPHMAFKEGWAEFVKASTRYYPEQTCGSSFDDNESSNSSYWICNADPDQYPDSSTDRVTYPNDGKSYIRNVKKLLCDWYDDFGFNDDDSNMAGTGDNFTASLESVWFNLDQMWDWAASRTGLTACDYTDYYLNGRKGAANVGSTKHDAYVKSVSNLAYNNGMSCGLEIVDEIEDPARAACKLADDIEIRPVSGSASSLTATISMPSADYHAIRGISNWEHGDRPCATSVTFGRFPNASGATPEVTRTSNNCSGSTGDEISVGVVRESLEGVFLGSLRVCRNDSGDRLKGIQVQVRTIHDDCTTEPFDPEVESTYPEDYASVGDIENTLTPIIIDSVDTRTNCSDWDEWRYCPANSVATGLVLHDGGSGINGIQLQCRDVIPR